MRKEIHILLADKKGFSLVEMLLALVVGTIILGAVFVAVQGGHRASTGIEQKVSVQQDVNAALDLMALEVGMASYKPNPVGAITWIDPTTSGCATPAANQTNKGIQIATASQLSVEMDADKSGVIGDGSNEIVTYTYDAANQRIVRATNTCGTGVNGQSFLGDLATADNTKRNVIVTNSNIFSYFDGQGNPTTNIPDIRLIKITLEVQAAAPDFQGQTRQMVYSTSVVPRNHAVPVY